MRAAAAPTDVAAVDRWIQRTASPREVAALDAWARGSGSPQGQHPRVDALREHLRR